MRYNIQINGDDHVYVNGGHKVPIDTFIQTIKDVNKSEKNKHRAYGGE